MGAPGRQGRSRRDARDAVTREVVEETGLAVRPGREVGVVRRAAPGGGTYEVHCFIVELLGGEAVAGSDAPASVGPRRMSSRRSRRPAVWSRHSAMGRVITACE